MAVFGLSRDKALPSLVPDGVILPQREPLYNLELLLDSQLLLKEQMAVMAKTAFAYLQVVNQVHPFLDQKALPSHLCNLSFRLVQHAVCRAAPEGHLETSTGLECGW